jgi:phospholipase/lecithinase/hemolysin
MHFRQFFTQACSAFVMSSLPLTLVVVIPTAAQAASFSRIYSFGDSLTDTGNSRDITEKGNLIDKNIPVLPPSSVGYFDGRFSNGPIWLDELAKNLGLALPPISRTVGGDSPTGVNFAINSATTGNTSTFPVPLPGFVGLEQQITQFKSSNPIADPNALYVVWAGANDYLGGQVTDPTKPVTNLSNAVTTLFQAGARNFLVANLPSLGATPLAVSRGEQTSNGLNQLTAGHNFLLSQSFNQLNSLPGINLKGLDVASLFDTAIKNPSTFGFTNVNAPCLVNSPLFHTPSPSTPISICSNPDQYLFWDDIHPTSAAHKVIGDLAFRTLTSPSKSIPEPSPVLGELAFGAFLGASAVLKWKQKKKTARANATLTGF